MSVINTQPLAGASGNQVTGYNLTKSVRLRNSASAYLNRTFTTPTNAKKFTWSGWVKRGKLGTNGHGVLFANSPMTFALNSATYTQGSFPDDTLLLWDFGTNTYTAACSPNPVLRDPSAWYHIVLAVDTTQATASNRVKIYINGTQFTTSVTIAQNTDLITAASHQIGKGFYGPEPAYFDGYLTEVNFVDGQQLTPSSFGETDTITGVWKPKAYTGTYGTNGFYLPFTDVATTSGSNAGLGKDFSGNGNYFNTNNISVTAGATYDSMTDVPTLTSATAANYAVLNPLFDASVSNSNGNLQTVLGTGAISSVSSTMGFTSGKYYCEATYVATGSSGLTVGVTQSTLATASQNNWSAGGVGYRSSNGNSNTNGAGQVAYGATFTTGDVIGIAVDTTANNITFYKNNTSQGALTLPTLASGASWLFSFLNITSAGTQTVALNFGQQGFTYTPPTGHLALNTYNLPDSTIVAGNKVMDASLWSGTETSTAIVNAGSFKPDFVWGKMRNAADRHYIFNSTTGVTKYLSSNLTDSEVTDSTIITSFNSNGFTLGTGNSLNRTGGYNFVGWQWQAGQGTTSSNTSGSITSTVSVNASAGFSIVTYTGNSSAAATIGHGLGVKPSFMIIRNRDEAVQWMAWHSSLSTQLGYLSLTDAFDGGRYSWALSSTQPTSTLITLGDQSNAATNKNGIKYVAYCWSEIAGFSKFGSYTGNGSSDGPFIYTGFRPKFVMYKRTDSTGSWFMLDSTRNTSNVTNLWLQANTNEAEQTDAAIDFLSNGFKQRTTGSGSNGSGASYVYMAFAENPFKNSLAR